MHTITVLLRLHGAGLLAFQKPTLYLLTAVHYERTCALMLFSLSFDYVNKVA